MLCVNCGGDTRVTESRNFGDCVIRRRKCLDCSFVFFTSELVDDEAILKYSEFHKKGTSRANPTEESCRKMSSKQIRVKYFDPDLSPLEKITGGDWIDLRAAERVELKKGDYHLIRLGVGMILPVGYEALIAPRSSTTATFGIMCAPSIGVIDNLYSGDCDEWHFPAIACRDTVINKGDRIAQFRIIKNQPRIRFKTVSRLNKKSRGGLGSTGRR